RVTKKDEIRHYIGDSPLLTGIEPGLKVKGFLDWENRYPHMKMHTAQHLVSAIVYNIHQASTVGNQIHADRSRVDFSPLSLDKVDTEEIEKQCNDIIRVNPPIKVFFEKRSVIEASKEADRCNLHIIPKTIRELRIVKIEEVELCPCAGTHVRSTGEIGGINITKLRSKGKGRVRITYELVAGGATTARS
ncbi:MAG: alanyl-tRNA editing protein, partial [Thermoplasmata archaeon]|nr:alanyl-tRNA editing protein [Thermoplasmata archaeon]